MNNYLQGLLFPLLLFTSFHSVAQTVKEDGKKDRIDVEYEACLTKDSSYSNICNCAFVAYDKWNKELDNAYKKLQRTLKRDKDKAALKVAQAAWVSFKDAEFKAYDIIFNNPGGKWCSMRQDGRIDIIRARAQQLRSYTEPFKK